MEPDTSKCEYGYYKDIQSFCRKCSDICLTFNSMGEAIKSDCNMICTTTVSSSTTAIKDVISTTITSMSTSLSVGGIVGIVLTIIISIVVIIVTIILCRSKKILCRRGKSGENQNIVEVPLDPPKERKSLLSLSSHIEDPFASLPMPPVSSTEAPADLFGISVNTDALIEEEESPDDVEPVSSDYHSGTSRNTIILPSIYNPEAGSVDGGGSIRAGGTIILPSNSNSICEDKAASTGKPLTSLQEDEINEAIKQFGTGTRKSNYPSTVSPTEAPTDLFGMSGTGVSADVMSSQKGCKENDEKANETVCAVSSTNDEDIETDGGTAIEPVTAVNTLDQEEQIETDGEIVSTAYIETRENGPPSITVSDNGDTQVPCQESGDGV